MKIVVGSTAAMFRLPEFKRKGHVDHDVWSDNIDELPTGKGYDGGVFSSEIMDAFEPASKTDGYASLNDLYTIKLSHLQFDIFWHKHLNDLLVFKLKYGAKKNERLYELLKEHWKEFHGNKEFLNLYRTKDEFFDDYVQKPYDHDYLHELVAYPNKPVYTLCLKDGQDVAIDKTKFDMLSFDQKVRMFREEIAVIANERYMINPDCAGKFRYITAWSKSLHKTVTALTKNWASEFLCENIELFLKPNGEEVHLHKTLGI